MDLLTSIEKYLKGQLTHSQGVDLLITAGGSNYLIGLLQQEDHYSRKKLKSELDKRFQELKSNFEESKFKSFAPYKKVNKIDLGTLPHNLRVEYARLSPLIREISNLHAKLEEKPTDQERYILANRIIECVKIRRGIFTRLDYYTENGRDLQPETPVIEKTEETTNWYEAQYKLKLLRSLRSKLSRNPGRISEHKKVCKEIINLEKVKKPTDA